MVLPFGQFDGQVRVKGVEDNDEEAVGHRAHQHDSQRDERIFDLRPNAIASVRDASERATVQDLPLPGGSASADHSIQLNSPSTMHPPGPRRSHGTH